MSRHSESLIRPITAKGCEGSFILYTSTPTIELDIFEYTKFIIT